MKENIRGKSKVETVIDFIVSFLKGEAASYKRKKRKMNTTTFILILS